MSQLKARKHDLSKQNGAANGSLLSKQTTSPDEQRITLSWHEIPEWQRDNEYIRTGYRRYDWLPGEDVAAIG
jgi:adiponectin receptor